MIVNTAKRHSTSGEVLNNKNSHDILTYNTAKLQMERMLIAIEISDQLVAGYKEARPRTRHKSLEILRQAMITLLKVTGKVLNVNSVTAMSKSSSGHLFKSFRDVYKGFIFYQSGFATNEGARPPIVGIDKVFADILLEQWRVQKGKIKIVDFNPEDYIIVSKTEKDLGDPEWNGEEQEDEFL